MHLEKGCGRSSRTHQKILRLSVGEILLIEGRNGQKNIHPRGWHVRLKKDIKAGLKLSGMR